MNKKTWANVKKSGAFKRKVKKNYTALLSSCCVITNMSTRNDNNVQTGVGSVQDFMNTKELISMQSKSKQNVSNNAVIQNGSMLVDAKKNEVEEKNDNLELNSDSSDYESANEDIKNDTLRDNLKKWAIQHNITQVALRDLNKILNNRIPYAVPADPRTLLNSIKANLNIIPVDSGRYWHNGLINMLKMVFLNVNIAPKSISLNVNIDGLPLFKSSKHQVWPILCNIHENLNIPPMVVGVYEGSNKPIDLDAYLQPFIDELLELYRNNLIITSRRKGIEIIIKVKLRAVICDSPARALIKGVSNFNSKHGCLKCQVIGEYSHVSHTVTFQGTDCPMRNDTDFRNKKYGNHHKRDSPFLQLPIDMIEDFPVGDSLHLLDLGITKRLLFGWRDGNRGRLITKWSSRDIEKVTQFILSCRMPKEL